MLSSACAGQLLPVAAHMTQFAFHTKFIRHIGARPSLNAIHLKRDGAFKTRTAIRGMSVLFSSLILKSVGFMLTLSLFGILQHSRVLEWSVLQSRGLS